MVDRVDLVDGWRLTIDGVSYSSYDSCKYGEASLCVSYETFASLDRLHFFRQSLEDTRNVQYSCRR